MKLLLKELTFLLWRVLQTFAVVVIVEIADINWNHKTACEPSWPEIWVSLPMRESLFLWPPNTRRLSLRETKRKSSILICGLLWTEALREIRCKCWSTDDVAWWFLFPSNRYGNCFSPKHTWFQFKSNLYYWRHVSTFPLTTSSEANFHRL